MDPKAKRSQIIWHFLRLPWSIWRGKVPNGLKEMIELRRESIYSVSNRESSGIFITADHRSSDRPKMIGDREDFVLADQFDRQT